MGTVYQTWKLTLLLCCLYLQPVYPLLCYQCSSTSKPECGDHFRVVPSEASNCAAGSHCVKYRGFRGSGAVKTPEVYRSCTIKFASNGCYNVKFNEIDQEACVCDSNYCNGATPIQRLPSPIILLVTLVTAVWVVMR